MKRIFYFVILMIFFNLLGCSNTSQQAPTPEIYKTSYEAPASTPAFTPTPPPTPTPEPPREIVIAAVGDIMFHSPQITAAFDGSTYDFKMSFEDIKPVLESADIAIGNFETTIHPTRKPSGYPRFNAPIEVLDALKDAGFDVLVTANNHSADTGQVGILYTIEMIEKYGMSAVGTGLKEYDKYRILEQNDIRVGILAYTSSTNGLPAYEGMVNLVDLEAIKKDIEEIKPKSDYIIVYVHTGTEYVREVEAAQEELFKAIADSGADCVLGSHPHVARQSELYKTNGREVLLNYSLGNFLSNQNDKYTDIGGLMQLSIMKHEGKTSLKSFELLPVYRLRHKENGKTIRKVILSSKVENNPFISTTSKSYILKVSDEITKLIENNEVR